MTPQLAYWDTSSQTMLIRDLTPEEIAAEEARKNTPPTIAEYLAAVDQLLDTEAKKKNYDSIHTAALRAGYPGPFHEEGVAYATWMDTVYATCYSILKQVTDGITPQPTVQGLIDMLPKLVLPT